MSVSAAFTGLNENFGSFFADVDDVTCCFEVAADEGCVDDAADEDVMELADGVSVRGGAGGGCSVSGRFVSLRGDAGGGERTIRDSDSGAETDINLRH